MAKAATIKKRRAQRGRPRDETCDREPNGRPQRPPREDPRIVAFKARAVHYGAPLEKADDPHWGTALGRHYLNGHIALAMADAGKKYKEAYDAYLRAMTAPVGLRVTSGAGDQGDIITAEYEDWAKKARDRWTDMEGALQKDGCRPIVFLVAVMDTECAGDYLPLLRRGLDRLACHVGLL